MSQDHSIIQLFAGTRNDGEPVFEKVAVSHLENGGYIMLHSPAFASGIARGDHFSLDDNQGRFSVQVRSGTLAVRVYSKAPVDNLDAVLTPTITQLEGRRDIKAAHVLVYSLPLEAGFEAIEQAFDEATGGSPDLSWSYGNVYDTQTGKPLDWWLATPDTKPAN